jgi:hypothetical protein
MRVFVFTKMEPGLATDPPRARKAHPVVVPALD